MQWREKVIDPSFDSLPDHVIMYKFAKKFGFADRMFRNITINGEEPLVEDVTREFNKGMWTIGYTGQSPERLKLHMENQHTFDRTTLQAIGGPADGDYYGLPRQAVVVTISWSTNSLQSCSIKGVLVLHMQL